MSTVATVSANTHASAADKARDDLRQAAQDVVGQVFYGTLMRQMRSSSLKGEYGHGGRGEEIFQAQFDQVLAERAGRGTRLSLTDAIVDRFERRAVSAAEHSQRISESGKQEQTEAGERQAKDVEELRW